MKKLFFFFLIIGLSGKVFSQYSDFSNFESVVKLPPGYDLSVTDFLSDPVTTNGFDNFFLGVDFGEPHIMTNPRDPLNSVCAFNINSIYYTLNGCDWIRTSAPFSGFSVLGDPVLAVDSIGTFYYTQLYQNGNTYGVAVMKSTNKGVNWIQPVSAFSTTVGLSDKQWIATDYTGGPYSGNIYLNWRQFGASGMRFVRSTNGGLNWSSAFTYTGGQGAYVTVGPNGNIQGGSVYIASLSGNSILVYRSTDGGATFGSSVNATGSFSPAGVVCAGRQTVKNCIRTNPFPKLSADNSYGAYRGNVYLVTEVNPDGPDIADVHLYRSTNFGASWIGPLRVNDDNTTTDQWLPAISVDKSNGYIYVSWYDSRVDPDSNLMTKVYGAVSTNGGVSFQPNEPISNVAFNPNQMRSPQPGGEAYIGDYFGISSIQNTSYAVWMEPRGSNLGSMTGFYPDFAMTTSESSIPIALNETKSVRIKIPDKKGMFSERIKFFATVDTLPASGNITLSFLNNRDSILTIPDSVVLNISTSGNVPPKAYYISVFARGKNGTPVHKRKIEVLVNSSRLTINTNRPNIITYQVNGLNYNSPQEFIFANGTNVSVSAPQSFQTGSSNYIFVNWSNGGMLNQNISINNNINLTATYKIQYRLVVNSTYGNTFGNNQYFDSASNANFGVNSRVINVSGTNYYFRGWTGGGPGSYTSADSLGRDTNVYHPINNPYVETARWSTEPAGIQILSSEIPDKYSLYQNFPNPFNPVTNIKFDIIKTANVKITIFDITGREVSLLVNEFKSPGKYSVSFDGFNLSSGIYYYKIETLEYIDVRKMILIK
ncbi:MAG TPA: hypothetical protein DEP28_01475 [Bacteroidetes bacterium]|nr:hypothetical protein [Bacteroidota bacterium]HCN37667.1 hypothetical protein [Bacteroidota bacterium]